VSFCVSLDHFDFVLLVLLVFFSVPSQEIGWEECLQNDLFCVEWGVKPSVVFLLHLIQQIAVSDEWQRCFTD